MCGAQAGGIWLPGHDGPPGAHCSAGMRGGSGCPRPAPWWGGGNQGGRQVPHITTQSVETRRSPPKLRLPQSHQVSGKGPFQATGVSHACACACTAPAPAHAHVFRHCGSKARQPGSPLCTANKRTVITGRGSRADKRIQNFNICCHKGIRRSETQSISLVSAGREPISKSWGGGTEGTRKKKGRGGGRKKERKRKKLQGSSKR